jgi:hypothetical protein
MKLICFSFAIFLLIAVVMDVCAGEWRFSAGPYYRGGMKAESAGSSYAQALPRTAARSDYMPGPIPPPCIPTVFDDGYVRSDGDLSTPSLTWNWGYDNDSQYNSAADTLSFHTAPQLEGGNGYTVASSVIADRDAAFSDTFGGCGVELSAGYMIKESKSYQVEFCAGVSTIWDAQADMSGSTFEEHVSERSYADVAYYENTYVYDVSGVSVPGAPYQGVSGGPEIPLYYSSSDSIGSTRTITTSEREWTNRNMIDMAVDTDIYSLWLGPRIGVRAGKQFSLHVIPRISVNYVDAGVNRRETFVRDYGGGQSELLQSWSDSGSKGDIIFGAGMSAGIDMDFENGMFAGLRGGYEWLSDKVSVDVGPGAVSVDAGGYTFGVVAGFNFGVGQ